MEKDRRNKKESNGNSSSQIKIVRTIKNKGRKIEKKRY